MKRRHFIATAAAGAATLAAPALSQSGYPERPIRVIVPNAPGGAADLIARTCQRPLEQSLGQPVAIVNVVGGGTSVGNRQVKDAAPDGHTVLAIHQALLTASILRVQDFGPDAFEKVAQLGSEFVGICVHRRAPYQDLASFLAAARAGTLRAGVQIGAWNHFLFLQFMAATGIQLRFVNTGSGGPTRTALAGQHIEVAYLSYPEAKPLLDSGDLTYLALMAPQMHPGVTGIRTAREQGTDLIQSTNFWWWMPKNTPRDRVARFAGALRQAMDGDDLRNRMRDLFIAPSFLQGAELEAEIDRQFQSMTQLARQNNVIPG